MCRLILAKGLFEADLVIRAAVSMSIGLTADHEGPTRCHPHGWGAIWHRRTDPGGALLVHRDVRPISESANYLPPTCVTADFMAIHVRHATLPANQGLRFTHPLERPHNVTPWYFMHNGFLPTVHRMLGKSRSHFDSAEYFDYVVPRGATALNGEETLSRLEEMPPGGSSGNAIAITPMRAYVIHWSPHDTLHRRYFTMHMLKRPDLLVVASEINDSLAPAEQWEPLQPKVMLEIPLMTEDQGGQVS